MQSSLEEESRRRGLSYSGGGCAPPLSLLSFPPSLPWGAASVSSSCLCVIHTCAQKATHVEKPHMQLQTRINKKTGREKKKPHEE